jgi:ATP adenylyltransferase
VSAIATSNDFALGPRALCSFCAALTSSGTRVEQPILEDRNFVAWVSDGALVEGHVLVIPRRHVLNLSELEADERSAFAVFTASVKGLLRDTYGAVATFEHGPRCAGSPVGCSIDHAHLHVLPWDGSLVRAAVEDYSEFDWRTAEGISGALDAAAADGPYLLVEDDGGNAVVAIDPAIPSQAIRKTIARRLEREEEWDWKLHPQTTTVTTTLRRLTSGRVGSAQ